MTPSQRAKELGCESLAQVVRVTKMNEKTLINWFNNPKKKDLFDIVCKGVSSERVSEKNERCLLKNTRSNMYR